MLMSRQSFLRTVMAGLALGPKGAVASRRAGGAAAPRFKMLYSNDATNIYTCNSPYHGHNQNLTTAMIDASIDEAAAADGQIIQPGLGWVPLWRSPSYPIQEHAAWFAARAGIPADRVPNDYIQYMLRGGDILGDFVRHCRAIGKHPIASLRLNDTQALADFNGHNGTAAWNSRFYVDHPEYRLGLSSHDQHQLAQNWAIPEVRAHKFRFIEEFISGYDIAGVELDFMRSETFFPSGMSAADRRKIMTDFVAAVRRKLDEKAGANGRLALCVRVPAVVDFLPPIGLDIPSLYAAGVDVFTLSSSFFTSQRFDAEVFRSHAKDAQLFVEMTHACAGIRDRHYTDPGHLRTTDAQFRTTAVEGVRRGLDGVALFNFAYFRHQNSVDPHKGQEPPFYLLPELAAPRTIDPNGDRWWFVAQGWGAGPARRDDWLPRAVKQNTPMSLSLYCIQPDQAGAPGLLRLRGNRDIREVDLSVSLNGRELTRTEFVQKPIPNPYDAGLGGAEEYRCFTCPRDAVQTGMNHLLIRHEGRDMMLTECDIVFKNT